MRSLRSLAVLAVAVSLAAGCGSTPPPGASSTPNGHPATSAPRSGPTPAPPRPAPASTSATAPPAPSAATQLAAFFAAAEHADSQIRHAAALINADITATSMRFTPATIAAVRGIQLAPVASALPVGLPTEMLREVLVVYGDLASRTDAFNGVQMYGSSGRQLLTGSPQAQSALRGLRNGTPAAARFNSDLAAARTLAQQTPLVTIAAPDSRAALELALRLQSISLRNSCSEEFGGYAPTSLETIIWQPGTDQHSSHYQGLIGGVRFTADYTVQHGWTINIYAC
jgi:hypothetical protein